MWMLLLAALALAEEPAPDPAEAAGVAPTQDPPEPEAEPEATAEPAAEPEVATAAELIVAASDRIHRADYEGARIVLDQARERARTDEEHGNIGYFVAMSLELGDDHAAALAAYDEVAASYPAVRTQDVVYRRAATLAKLGRHDEAQAALDAIGPLSASDQKKVDLMQGIWLLQAGERDAGRLALATVLQTVEPGEVAFTHAWARAAIAESFVQEAAEYTFDVSPKKQVKNFSARGELIGAAGKQVAAVVQTGEIEWILHGLLVIGDAMAEGANDFARARPPGKIRRKSKKHPELLEAWRAEFAPYIEASRAKALSYYQNGIDLALANQWGSKKVDELLQAKARVEGEF